MAKNLEIKGLDKVIKNLKAIRKRMAKELPMALLKEGNAIMTESKTKYVPVETGALRSSGRANTPVTRGDIIKVTLSYGGAAAPYAAAIHEAPNDWNWSVAGTGPKYLEIPAKKAVPGMSRRIARDLKGKL